ncbi:hypothetical protein [Streptomyces sp. V1I6]|uniref:hypothetical protein n=1 Tax=Streptomyces sp. V1I6 TaxID=3042273 RepID=UPI00278139E5|nr:hypothetical protein [Streptomyces sp. V1I6]MDQ0846916.1 hypothetical protein [Streptomyces sp. V1I6]
MQKLTSAASGCIPPNLASRLLELGHAEKVEFRAGHGEWFCAREWTRLLGEQGRQAEVLEILPPYLATVTLRTQNAVPSAEEHDAQYKSTLSHRKE